MKRIQVEHLTKTYQLHIREKKEISFRELLFDQVTSFLKRGSPKSAFNALDDITFDVEEGEVLGIIGKNGSGKSTLLKILSKITTPTSGRAIIRGRVASLLEVGTGFHAELSGRENIYLSGVILGMRRWEINQYFEEIVDFSGVEKFLDTPVKRYSSGMKLRLAFGIAAHLRPEILLVDELLSVGDYDFEKKCLQQINKLSSLGRTVLLVSHSMIAIQRLCSRCLVLAHGKISFLGQVSDALTHYFSLSKKEKSAMRWDKDSRPKDDLIEIESIRVIGDLNEDKAIFASSENIGIEVAYNVFKENEKFSIMLWFYNDEGNLLFTSLDTTNSAWHYQTRQPGYYKSICMIPKYFLNPGTIYVTMHVITTGKGFRLVEHEVVSFSVLDPTVQLEIVGDWAWGWPNVMVRPLIEWQVLYNKIEEISR